jgi:hypothetical protein
MAPLSPCCMSLCRFSQEPAGMRPLARIPVKTMPKRFLGSHLEPMFAARVRHEVGAERGEGREKRRVRGGTQGQQHELHDSSCRR